MSEQTATAGGKPRLGPLPSLIFASRWLQLPLYLGLIVAQCVYVFLFLKELKHLVLDANTLTEQGIMLLVLGLIDVVMISNLLVMVIVGGYETFVSRLNLQGHPDQPEWLSHVNASVLKVKLAMAIIGISSIHLLKTFIEAGVLGGMPLCGTEAGLAAMQAMTDLAAKSKGCTTVTEAGVMWQTVIHMAFIVSAIGIAWTDKLMSQSVALSKKH
ncbi:MAG TPA: TIGR00645 family protein [Arenimonas sp.]|nr:TIGR00645 family protein [Arenimonas sp.]